MCGMAVRRPVREQKHLADEVIAQKHRMDFLQASRRSRHIGWQASVKVMSLHYVETMQVTFLCLREKSLLLLLSMEGTSSWERWQSYSSSSDPRSSASQSTLTL